MTGILPMSLLIYFNTRIHRGMRLVTTLSTCLSINPHYTGILESLKPREGTWGGAMFLHSKQQKTYT